MKKEEEGQLSLRPEIRLFLRVYSHETDLDFWRVKQVLGISDEERSFAQTFLDRDGEIAVFVFATGEEFPGSLQFSDRDIHEAQLWQRPEFRVAWRWLQERNPVDFQALGDAGWRADLCFEGYEGLIPDAVLGQLVRLGIHLWVFNTRK